MSGTGTGAGGPSAGAPGAAARSSRGWAGWGFAARLAAGIVAVVVVAGLTAVVVAGVVGPSVFHEHMLRAGAHATDATVVHAEEAFRDASVASLGLAIVAALAVAAAVSVVVGRRVSRSLGTVSTAAAEVGAGRYDVRLPATGLGAEFDDLSGAVTTMAARLQDAERLRSRLLADVAHEVRTPVATLGAYLEAVEDGVEPLDATTLGVLRDQVTRLGRLAEDLAAVTHAEAGDLALDLAELTPAELVTAAAGAARERAVAAGIAVAAQADPGLPAVAVDRARLAQVLDNLVANALRHTPSGGTVTLGAATGSAPGTVTLTVADTGEGIGPEHLPHVFERFYRADTARDRATGGGSGIGLAISKALVEAHGGTIAATSDGPGRGATFVVTLPAAG